MYADVDNGADTMKKKILLGEQAHYNFIFGRLLSSLWILSSADMDSSFSVVGQDEMENRAVNVRNRDAGTKARGEIMALDEIVSKLIDLKAQRRLENTI